MSGRNWVRRLACAGVLTPLACGGVSIRDDSGQGGAGAARAGRSGTDPVPGTGGAASSSGGSFATGGKASLGGSSAGGSVSVGGGKSIDSCPYASPIEGELITDCSGDAPIFDLGGYYIYQDVELGGATLPDASIPEPMVPVPEGYVGNGLRFQGDGFAPQSWGAGFGVWLDCFDAGAASGLSLWIKSTIEVDVGLATPATQSVVFGGKCSVEPCVANYVRVPAAADWVLVQLDFEAFANGTAPFDPSAIVGVNFAMVPPPAVPDVWDFQVWVDEIRWTYASAGAGGQAGAPQGGYGGAP